MDDSTNESKNYPIVMYHTHSEYPISYKVLLIFFLKYYSKILSFVVPLQILLLNVQITFHQFGNSLFII